MAVTISRNLKLRIDSNLTANAKYNLERIDALGGVYLLDNTETVNIRSKVNINLRPEDSSVGGSGTGGTVTLGASGQNLDSLLVYADTVSFSGGIDLADTAAGGDKSLTVRYKSDSNSSVDTSANRILSIDPEGADRSLVLGGDFQFSGGNLALSLSSDTSLTLPTTGTLATLAGAETLINKTLNADNNTITNISNSSIKAAAGIVYSKLTLSDSIVNADINSSAAIAYSKLNLSGSILNSDINNSAAISYSKLDLDSSILDSDISSSAAISYSKLNLTGLVTNSDIASGAAIAGTKISPNFGSQNIQTSGALRLSDGSNYTELFSSGLSGNISLQLPNAPPTASQVLRANSSTPGILEWADVAGTGTVTSVGLSAPSIFTVSGSPVTGIGTLALSLATQTANTVWAGPTAGGAATPAFRSLVEADIPSALPATLLADGSVTNTEFQYLANVTSDIQSQLNNKQPLDSDLTALGQVSSTGILTRTASNTFATRTVTAGTGISVDNGDGVSGNPTINSTITQYTDEMAQDAVGGILTDTDTIDFTYDDSTPAITAAVIPAAVDHDQLLNFVANEHVDHSSVEIATSATSGLSGGGDLTSTRNIVVDPTAATSATITSSDTILFADADDNDSLKKDTVASLLSAVGGSYAEDWTSMTSTTITHSLGSRDVMVELYDNDTFETVMVDSIVRTDTDTVDLTASQAPTGSGWRVLIRKI